jgi:transglutaminase-like putative cysteine protease
MAEARRDRPIATRPAEGWLSVVAMLVMLVDLGTAVDVVRWAGSVPGTGQSQTWFLSAALVLGAAWGLVGAKLRWHVLLTHAAGAILGAAFAIYVVAKTIPAVQGVSLPAEDPYHLANLVASVQLFLHDVFVLQIRSGQTSAFLLVVAAVGWASGQFAAFAVYRHHRPMSAVLFLGLLLLASMSLTVQRGQYPFLVVYAAASLFLLVRLSLAEQRALWANMRLGDAGSAFSLYLRNGVTFIVIALLGAVVLTSTASSAPLSPLLSSSANQFYSWASQFDRFASGIVAPVRGPSGLFGESQTIQGFWQSSPVLVYRVTSSDGNGYYWQGATYDDFNGRTWTQSEGVTAGSVAAGSPVLAGSTDQVKPGAAYRSVRVTVSPVNTGDPTVLAPQTPYSVSLPTQVKTAGAGGPVDTIRLTGGLAAGGSYTVTSLVRNVTTDQITANELAASGTVYPEWARQYIAIEPGSIGPTVKEAADRIIATLPAGQRDPYHEAKALQDWLYSGGNFIYDTDVQGACAPGTPVPDCLLQSKRGYCEYFATTLVMMLRTQQIPARYVVGYLPGHPTASGVFQVDASAAHAWVEVYFPHYGWVRFDPTPGNATNGQQPTNLPNGPPVATPTPKPGSSPTPHAATFVPDNGANGNPRPPRVGEPGGNGSGSTGGAQGPLPLVIGLGLVMLAVVLVVLVRLRFGARPSPAGAYNGVARIATRFGYAPRPAQTVYEYASMLGDVLPSARPDLEVVARARVEATYAHRALGADRRTALGHAYGRLRLRLLRLALRYRPRRR